MNLKMTCHPLQRTRLLIAFVATLFAVSVFLHQMYFAPRVQAVSTSIVISQFQVAGGTAADEFLEIHNVSNISFDLNGHRVVYRSAAGTSDVTAANWTTSTIIPAGGYYLIASSVGYDGATVPDTTFSSGATGAWAAAGGGFAIRNGAANTGAIVDSVGYGTATNAFIETTVTTAPAANQSKARLSDGCTDTDNNSADFTTLNPSVPRNSATAAITCGGDAPPNVSSTVPTSGATNVALASDITVTFSEPVNATTASFTISCVNSGTHTFALSGGPATFTLNPDVDFAANETCTVTVIASQVTDQDGSPDNMTTNFSASFTTVDPPQACGDPATFIHAVQGSGATSPITGSIVSIEGVVIADYQGAGQFSGYFVQEEDADADADPATSEGIFVFNTAFPVNVGDKVRVRGTVTEFLSSGQTLTELASVSSVLVCNSGNSVSSSTVILPVANLTDWERYEGMLINIPQNLTVTETFTLGRFGEVSLSVPNRLSNPTNIVPPGAPAIFLQDLNDRSRIVLDDGNNLQNIDPTIYPTGGLSASNTLRSGYTVNGLAGVLEQRFGVYRVQPVGAINFNPTNPRTATPDSVGGTVKVAAFNVLNYFNGNGMGGGFPTSRGADTLTEFNRQRAKIISAIVTMNADIIGLMELENDALGNSAIEDLVSGLNAATAPGTYAFIDTGVVGTDEIRVGLIYKPGSVTPLGSYAILDSTVDPTFIDTLNRPTLAQTFVQNSNGARLTVAVNHLKSKGSACAGDPDTGDGQGNCNLTRTAAANALVNWLVTDPTGSGDPDFIIIGDLNSYAMEDPITAIKNGGYTDLINSLIGPGAYSYVFEGQSGYLDHALASSSLVSQVTGITEWHTNADEPIALDYNVEFKTANQLNTFYAPDAFRASDHDPVLVGLNLDADNDGVPDATDNCPNVANPDQADFDNDGIGDACDACPLDPANDADGDGICGNVDNCPLTANPDQADADGDGIGNACDACPLDPANDADGDGVCGNVDNCPTTFNPDQRDTNGDGVGDACTPFQFPSGGLFVVGNLVNITGGATVYYWGSQWSQNNPMTGGSGPNAFKGFENGNALPTCGSTWTSQPGNSSNPPPTVPQFMAVIVSSSVVKNGSVITGNIKKIVVIQTNPGYGPSPGHAGTGKVVAILCSSP